MSHPRSKDDVPAKLPAEAAPWSSDNGGVAVESDASDAPDAPEDELQLPGIEQVPEYVPLSSRATTEADTEATEDRAQRGPIDADFADDPELFDSLKRFARAAASGVRSGARLLGGSSILTSAATALGVPAPVASAVTGFLKKARVLRESGVAPEADATPSLLEVVIGADDRVQIHETATSPWSGICHLGITAPDGQRFIGTGWLISPRCVITAGHCVFIRGAGGWAKSIQVTAGRNGGSFPFGQVTATQFSALPRWVSFNDRNFDCGCIILPKPFRASNGAQPFTFRYAAKSDDAIRARALNLSGYPGDKGGITQWFHARGAKTAAGTVITYDIDSAGGQSGSPVWHLENGVRTAVGIHTNGSPLGNSATRITAALKAQLDEWRAAGS